MARKILTIIIPVRHEEKTIGETVALLTKTVRTPHVIMISDDTVDPSDRTLEMIVHSRNLRSPNSGKEGSLFICKKAKDDANGFGPALVRAIQKVMTPYTVFVMADQSDDPKAIDGMVEIARQKRCDMVAGCRYMKGGKKIGGPYLQGILSTVLNTFLYYITRFPTRDATNAFKLYRTPFLQSILPEKPKTGVEFSFQLTIRAVSKNARIIDVPTIWRGREKGQSKVRLFSRGPKYMKLLIEGLWVQLGRLLV